jgi:cytochrome P450
VLTEHMLNADPPDHGRLRRLVSKVFTAQRVRQLVPKVEQITEDLLDELPVMSQVDLIEHFAFPLPNTVVCDLLGAPPADRAHVREWSHALFSASDLARFNDAGAAMEHYLSDLIASKRREPSDDLLSALVEVRDSGDCLTEIELVSMSFLLLSAGHETTVNLIGNGVHVLLRNPDQLAAIRADETLIPRVIEEILRFEGPVNVATFRYTEEPVQVCDVSIPEGELVLVAIGSADHDDTRFAEPGRLDLTRSTEGHLAFGHGIHFCLGASLARLEGTVALRELLRRFPNIELAVLEDQLRWRPSMLFRGLEALPVRLS